MSVVTYRMIAERAGVSHVAVSYAMRNRPGVSKETRERVLKTARELGYRINPMVAALMSSKQRARLASGSKRAIIAALVNKDPVRLSSAYMRDSIAGLRHGFDQAGFIFEELYWGDFNESPKRLFSSLRARRTPGVVFLAEDLPHWCLDGWQNYALASIGNRRLNISCDYVSSDHYMETWMCMEELAKLGYRRIGISIEKQDWQVRNAHRHLAACLGWNAAHQCDLLFYAKESWDETEFLDWVRHNRLDAVVSSYDKPLHTLRQAGLRVPEDIGFAHLGLRQEQKGITGIYQNNFLTGVYAAQLLVDRINNNDYGATEHPKAILVKGDWVEGATTRLQATKAQPLQSQTTKARKPKTQPLQTRKPKAQKIQSKKSKTPKAASSPRRTHPAPKPPESAP